MRLYGHFVTAICFCTLACTPVTQYPKNDGDAGFITCVADEECPTDWSCLGGICSEFECQTKETCAAGTVCKEGRCVDPPEVCAGPEDCPGTTICEGFTHRCIDPNVTGCRNDFDCDLEPGCSGGCDCNDDGACVPRAGEDGGPPPDAGPSPDAGPIPSIDLGGFRLENREHSPAIHIADIPAGTRLQTGQLLIIGRESNRGDFEVYWNTTLGPDVIYLNSNAASIGVPIINGGERWALLTPSGTLLDGITITGAKNKSYQRISPDTAEHESNWTENNQTDATPGVASLGNAGVGLVISEWSDTPTYLYEYIELYYAP